MATTCLDDPATILEKEWCLSALSKDLSGELHLGDSKSHQCQTPPCKTLKTVNGLKMEVAAHPPCDSRPSALLNGSIVVERLVTVFDQDGNHRGFHAGDFLWNGAAGIQVKGRMSGSRTSEPIGCPPSRTARNATRGASWRGGSAGKSRARALPR
jgi:hypothetical protein